MSQFQPGYTFTDGKPGDANAANLRQLIEAAQALPGLISDQPAATVTSPSDLVLILEAISGELRKAALSSVLIPSGVVLSYGGSLSPDGWLLCYGQAVARTQYAGLFAAIGTAYGVGDGSTTFNIPDLRGRVPVGKDDMGGVSAARLNLTYATTGTTTSGSSTISAIPNTNGLLVGMKIAGTGIPDGTTITTITNTTSIVISANATASNSGVALAFTIMDGATLGAAGGNQKSILDRADMPAGFGLGITVINPTNRSATGSVRTGSFTLSDGTVAEAQTNTAVGGTQGEAHANVQPSLVTNMIIKT